MGLLDDAIREHLELKRRHGADPEEVARQENEALGPPQRAEFAEPAAGDDDGAELDVPPDEPEDQAVWVDDEEAEAPDLEPGTAELPEPPPAADEDVLEATPEFLEETPEHDRLWFEQKPPKDFDFDN
jgi:hypothetical protein